MKFTHTTPLDNSAFAPDRAQLAAMARKETAADVNLFISTACGIILSAGALIAAVMA